MPPDAIIPACERALLQATEDLTLCSAAAWEKQRSAGTTAEKLWVDLQHTQLLLREVLAVDQHVIGARLGGIALGTVSGIGLAVFVFGFGMPPGSPPATVLGMILAVITALSMMEAAGGLDYLVETAEGVLRRNPQRITFLAPLVTYILIFAAGTQHVIYALLPVIAEVARKAGVRPERPLSMSVIAAQHGLIASPVSAVTVALVAAETEEAAEKGAESTYSVEGQQQ